MKKSYNKDTFCVAPWLSSHISTFDDILPCCIYKAEGEPFGKTKQGVPFLDHYNSNTAVQVRKDLWNGKEVSGCKECFFREKTGNSYRNSLNQRFDEYIDEAIDNTNDDFTLKQAKFRMLDLRFDNKCNLRCRMCNPSFSSALYKEYKDLGFETMTKMDSAYIVAVDNNEYQFILDQLQHTKVLFFAGGEPLTQDKFYEILQYCIDNDLAKDIMLWITTNCTKLNYKKFNLIEMFKQFKGIEITGSVDAYGERANYMRYPSKWTDVESNILTLINSVDNLTFIACPTIQIPNVHHIFDLYKYFIVNKITNAGDIHFNILEGPKHFSIRNLPENHKEQIRTKCDEMLIWLEDNDYSTHSTDKQQFELLRSMLDQEPTLPNNELFLRRTKQVDDYRGNNFYETFPEFNDFLVVS